ncbi:MAG: aquaporin [Elusimicrobia bacterium]|nr:aquaporin [Elusimicrobiota bacterium]
MAGNLRAYIAELIGTFALILIGAGSVCMDAITGGKLGLTGIAFAHGLTIMVMAYALGNISGGHFNPAVSIAMLLTKKIEMARTVGYIAAQLLGATLAGIFLSRLLHNYSVVVQPPYLGALTLSQIGCKGATLLEAVMTFFLVTTIFGTALDERGSKVTAPIAIGMCITADILVGGSLTGAGVNPARAFGPAVSSGYWTNHLVYWIGPIVGAVGAAFLYDNFLKNKS